MVKPSKAAGNLANATSIDLTIGRFGSRITVSSPECHGAGHGNPGGNLKKPSSGYKWQMKLFLISFSVGRRLCAARAKSASLIVSDATTRSSVRPFPATESDKCAPTSSFRALAHLCQHLEEQDATSMAGNSDRL